MKNTCLINLVTLVLLITHHAAYADVTIARESDLNSAISGFLTKTRGEGNNYWPQWFNTKHVLKARVESGEKITQQNLMEFWSLNPELRDFVYGLNYEIPGDPGCLTLCVRERLMCDAECPN